MGKSDEVAFSTPKKRRLAKDRPRQGVTGFSARQPSQTGQQKSDPRLQGVAASVHHPNLGGGLTQAHCTRAGGMFTGRQQNTEMNLTGEPRSRQGASSVEMRMVRDDELSRGNPRAQTVTFPER